ncbi:methyltransferase family protein [Saccharopolyspora erythraea NRRL 2338]|uniref:Ubiquinone/menaquinone biosynthesis methyltransferase n=2 Tax=Saccharopolyspora erythraea TaxID=1836 RepID=A4FIY5_SACEN|nr:class I SAM-dependent methyltransferase [Saccharopolyspora erythraea]EQD86157.1 SAM-dependent methyltransferase [Saccharopolyspora erythraea D]PFG97682.1 methyltransferase family protein [Saccharopolyspora erythraea NRRL 2338]QRK87836.1 class I SAM-dependent methyltransferase [Saccharopolyspora erythraea]CAM04010.1 ubiquinone/menaquinone biosynthesis methyltransferase [Saccharopolyspora erythraea NRRL 2338]
MGDVNGALDAVRRNWDRRARDYNRFYRRFSADRRDAWRTACEKIVPALRPGGAGPLDVLDVGTGTGFLSTLLAELGHRVTAVDPSATMLGYAREEAERRGVDVSFRECGAHDVEDLASTFDLVTARYVLWTLPAPVRATAAWSRVLRPGGAVLIADSTWHTWRGDGRRLLASLRPGGDHGFAWRLLRDYVRIGRATPNWKGLTPQRAQAILAAGGFRRGERFDDLLPEFARPVGEGFFITGARVR